MRARAGSTVLQASEGLSATSGGRNHSCSTASSTAREGRHTGLCPVVGQRKPLGAVRSSAVGKLVDPDEQAWLFCVAIRGEVYYPVDSGNYTPFNTHNFTNTTPRKTFMCLCCVFGWGHFLLAEKQG